MKIRNTIIAITCILLFNSCIVKSLQPFYTKNAIAFQESFIGEWDDGKKGHWKVISIKEVIKKDDFFLVEKPSKEDLDIFKTYEDGYLIKYTKEDKEAYFIAMPFKVNNQLFLDFTPFSEGVEGTNGLLSEHLLNTHSLVKFDREDNGNVSIKWLSESRIEALINNNQIRIKHEKIGIPKDLILTASSEELMAFIEKYSKSTIEDKWKTSSKYNLKRINVKP